MCMLSYFPPGAPVDSTAIYNGGTRNPHGHGWAIVSGAELLLGKSLDLDQAMDQFTDARKRHPTGPALFHSRWATHGSMGLENVHPFRVGRSAATVVAHNGILPSNAHPGKGDDRSDTRKFADDILPQQYRKLDRANVQRALSLWCGRGNKLVILTTDRRYRCSAYIINESEGLWDGESGVWHSNSDYLSPSRWGAAGVADLDAAYDLGDCDVCGCGSIDGTGYCGYCRSCQDCLCHVRECLCWSGLPLFMRER